MGGPVSDLILDLRVGCGGETGIRTLETVSRLHTFQACAFDHSATSPLGGLLTDQKRNCKSRSDKNHTFFKTFFNQTDAGPSWAFSHGLKPVFRPLTSITRQPSLWP